VAPGYGRPILCTEYMARPQGSTFQSILPIAKKYGLRRTTGIRKRQDADQLPWDSWQHAYTDSEPPVWFHDVLTADGKPYRPEEADSCARSPQERPRRSPRARRRAKPRG